MFRSSSTQGARVIGVVLSGQLDDGTSGLWAIKDRGGTSIVQSPRDAQYPSMPMRALQHVKADHVVDVIQSLLQDQQDLSAQPAALALDQTL